jgi:tetratricopeptide (TPR) repeat protein
MPKKSAERPKLNPREKRNLETEIGFMEGIILRDPDYVDALQILGDDYTKDGRFLDGLMVDERLSKLRPNDALIQYNLACSYSLTKLYQNAAQAIERAIDLGYRDFRWISRDPDLRSLRRTNHFKRIRAKIEAAKTKSAP